MFVSIDDSSTKVKFLESHFSKIIAGLEVLREISVNHNTWELLIIFPTASYTTYSYGSLIVMWTWFVRQTRMKITDTRTRLYLIVLVRRSKYFRTWIVFPIYSIYIFQSQHLPNREIQVYIGSSLSKQCCGQWIFFRRLSSILVTYQESPCCIQSLSCTSTMERQSDLWKSTTTPWLVFFAIQIDATKF